MDEENVQIIQKDGSPEYAVIPIEDYRHLAAVLGVEPDDLCIQTGDET